MTKYAMCIGGPKDGQTLPAEQEVVVSYWPPKTLPYEVAAVKEDPVPMVVERFIYRLERVAFMDRDKRHMEWWFYVDANRDITMPEVMQALLNGYRRPDIHTSGF